jgi:hypothetical protein
MKKRRKVRRQRRRLRQRPRQLDEDTRESNLVYRLKCELSDARKELVRLDNAVRMQREQIERAHTAGYDLAKREMRAALGLK